MPFFVSGRSPIDGNWTWVEGEDSKTPYAFPSYELANIFAQGIRTAGVEIGPSATRIWEGSEIKPDTKLLEESELEIVTGPADPSKLN